MARPKECELAAARPARRIIDDDLYNYNMMMMWQW